MRIYVRATQADEQHKHAANATYIDIYIRLSKGNSKKCVGQITSYLRSFTPLGTGLIYRILARNVVSYSSLADGSNPKINSPTSATVPPGGANCVSNETTAPAPPAPVVFTDAAASKVGELIKEEQNPDLKLRVFISGGGCSGFQYGFTFDDSIEDGDAEVVNQGVTLVIDPMSVQYLMGAEIDYKEDLQGAQFIIRNPNATTTCGCGQSFTA